MKRALLLGLVAVFGVSILSDSAEARLFGRRRASYSNSNCSSCNSCNSCQSGCEVPGQYDPNYNPNMGNGPNAPGYAPPPAPNAQTYSGSNNQGNTTFYRGNPQQAPNAQGRAQTRTDLNTPPNAPLAPNAEVQGRAGANLNRTDGNNADNNLGRERIQGGVDANLND